MGATGIGRGLYLLYMLVLVPWLAFRSARSFRAMAADPDAPATKPPLAGSGPFKVMPPLARIYANTLLTLVVLFVLSWLTGRTFGYRVFAAPRFRMSEVLAGTGTLAFQFAAMYLNLAAQSPDDARGLTVNRLLPRTARENVLYAITVTVAAVAEEAAYRGVLVVTLWHVTGTVWVAMCISALAFSLGHAVQGRRSMAVIFVMACSMHALVWFTGTLTIAMVVHAAYDLLAPTVLRRISPEPPTGPERSAG